MPGLSTAVNAPLVSGHNPFSPLALMADSVAWELTPSAQMVVPRQNGQIFVSVREIMSLEPLMLTQTFA